MYLHTHTHDLIFEKGLSYKIILETLTINQFGMYEG